jgi:hypothetical protein
MFLHIAMPLDNVGHFMALPARTSACWYSGSVGNSAPPPHQTCDRGNSSSSSSSSSGSGGGGSSSNIELVQFVDVVIAACDQLVDAPTIALVLYSLFGVFLLMPFLHLIGMCHMVHHNTKNT